MGHSQSLIHFSPEKRVFHLRNNRISYLFSVGEGGLLQSLYFGRKVSRYSGQLDYPLIDRGFSGNLPGSLDRRYSKDTLPQEYSSSNSGDYRLPALTVRLADGSRTVYLTYRSHVIISGKPSLSGLPASYVEYPDEAETLVVTLEDTRAGIEVALSYTIFRDIDVIARSVSIRNTGSSPLYLEKVASMQLDSISSSFEVLSLPGGYANERSLERSTIDFGTKRLESRRGSSSHQMNPFVALLDPLTSENQGEAYGFALVYSGNHAIELEKDSLGQLRLTIGINSYNFEWQLAAGESFQTPEVLMTYSWQGLNQMSHTFHQVIRERVVRSAFKKKNRPILINNWEATYFDYTEDDLRPLVDEAAKLGIELFVLDDGWFGHRENDTSSLGDWFVNPRKFPNGLKQFAEYVHAKGLRFGLWVEPEMISMDSELYRNHPDYLMQVPGQPPSPSRGQFVLDLGRREIREYLYDCLHRLLEQGFVDYIKWDMNRHLTDIYSLALPFERQGEVSHRYVLGLYELLERLTTAFPEVLVEGCSGGGGRFDVGLAYYMPQSWASDNTDAFARLSIQHGTSLLYPISLTTAHVSAVPNHQTGRITTLDMRAHVAMSGVLGYELDLTTLTTREKEQIAEQIVFYKQVRSLVQFGRFYRLVADGNDWAWMFVSEDKKRALVFTARLFSSAQTSLSRLRLQGLLPDLVYEVKKVLSPCAIGDGVGYFDSLYAYKSLEVGVRYSGEEWMQFGFYQPLARMDGASHLYYLEVEE